MADQRITQLNELPKAGVSATDVLPIADVSASETKKVTVKNLTDAGLDLVDPASIDLDKLDQNSVTKLGTVALADDAVTAAKLADDSSIVVDSIPPTADNFVGRGHHDSATGNLTVFDGTAYQQVVMPTAGIGDLQVTTAKLATGAVTTDKVTPLETAAYADLSVTTPKLADEAVTAAKIQSDSITAAQLAPGAVETSELALGAVTYDRIQDTSANVLLGQGATSGTVQEIPCTAAGRALLDDADAAAQRTTLGLGDVATADQVSTDQIQDDAVTADKLANQSSTLVVASLPGTGDFVGQQALITGTQKTYIWDGATWVAGKAAGSVNTITSDNTGIVNTSVVITDGDAVLSTSLDDTTAPAQFLAGPTSAAGSTTYRAIAPGDLPTASNLTKGAVVVNGNGLIVSGDTVAIDNAVPENTTEFHVVQYSANGLVTAGRTIIGPDVPPATGSTVGVVVPGDGLAVEPDGTLNHTNNVAAGTGTKITFDGQGHVVATSPLEEADIPDIPADKITTGTLLNSVIPNGSLTRYQLADYAISYIQEGRPTEVDPGSIGMLWLQESTAQLRMWNGNSWFAVGLGRLVQENLRFGGLVDASTGLVTIVTRFGLNGGLAVGAPLPNANDLLGGLYVVAQVGGANISQTPGVTYDEGDWCLCIDQANGWERIDTLSGGGGGVQFLNDLLDVTLTTPQTGDTLIYDANTGTWVNKSTTSEKVTLVEPFDGIRTIFNTPQQISDARNLILSLGGIIQDPGVDFTATPGGNQITFVAAPPTGTEYWILQESSISSGGSGTTLPPGTAAEELLQWNNTLGSWQPTTVITGGTY